MNSPRNQHPKTKKLTSKRIFITVFTVLIVLSFTVLIAFKVSPYPSALLIRYVFDKEAVKVNAALEKHLTGNVSAILNEHYNGADEDAKLDVYFPAEAADSNKILPVIVWIHGGAWISGSKDQVANYCKIIAAQGYVVVPIDYSIAPGEKYPVPVIQANEALAYLLANAKRFHINPAHFILAGDSGGAHIAAQTANLTCDSSFAKLMSIYPSLQRSQISGTILFCGPYNVEKVNLEGPFGSFLNTVLWSYSGGKDYMTNPTFATASIIKYISPNFPSTFISVGNTDPLANQSYDLAKVLAKKGVHTDGLFFTEAYASKLGHEYQFNLDTDAGKLALSRCLQFLTNLQMQ